MKQVLVTGGNGFIGSHLVEYLIDHQYAVRCLVRHSSDLKWIDHLDIDLFYGDLTDGDSLKQALAGVDLVFHLGGKTKAIDKAAFTQANVEGTRKLLEILADSQKIPDRFVYVSSQAAVGPSLDGRPVTELDSPGPVTEYGRSKLEAERLVLEYQDRIPMSIVRPPSVFGPRDRDVYEIFKMANLRFFPKMGRVNQSASLIFVEDLVRGLVLIAESPATVGCTYHMVTEINYPWRLFAKEIADYLGKRLFEVTIPFFVFRTVLFTQQVFSRVTGRPSILNEDKLAEFQQPAWILDGEKARRELDFKGNWETKEAIRKTAA